MCIYTYVYIFICIYIYIYIHIKSHQKRMFLNLSQKSPLCCAGFPIANRPTESQNVASSFSLPNHKRLQTLRP